MKFRKYGRSTDREGAQAYEALTLFAAYFFASLKLLFWRKAAQISLSGDQKGDKSRSPAILSA
jgi:hypothetical protein